MDVGIEIMSEREAELARTIWQLRQYVGSRNRALRRITAIAKAQRAELMELHRREDVRQEYASWHEGFEVLDNGVIV